MPYYIFRESESLGMTLPNNAMINFDVLRGMSSHNLNQGEPDFEYITTGPDTGAFVIKIAGPQIIVWTVAQMTGRSQDGAFFQLKYKDGNTWVPVAGKADLKVSSATGMGTLMVYPHSDTLPEGSVQLDEDGRLLLGLFNVSGNSITTNRNSYMKASLIMTGFNTLGPDLGEMEVLSDLYEALPRPNYIESSPQEVRERMKEIEGKDRNQNNLITGTASEEGGVTLLQKAKDLFTRMTQPSAPQNLRSSEIPGLGVSVINTGHTYNFWNVGTVETLSPVLYEEATDVFLAQSKDAQGNILFLPLTWLGEGERMEGMCYVHGSDPHDFMPIYFDARGVYLKVPAGYQFMPNSKYSFIRTLILKEYE